MVNVEIRGEARCLLTYTEEMSAINWCESGNATPIDHVAVNIVRIDGIALGRVRNDPAAFQKRYIEPWEERTIGTRSEYLRCPNGRLDAESPEKLVCLT